MTTTTAPPHGAVSLPLPVPRTRARSARRLLTVPVEAVRRLLGVLTRLGRAVAVAGIVCWLVGWRLGWDEFMLAAATCLLLLVMAVAFTVGRMDVDVAVSMQPPRVVVGETATGQISATNASHRRLLALRLELVVGGGLALFDIPVLPSGRTRDELFSIPTHRRAIITVGPSRTLRSDPLGMLRRAIEWPSLTTLFVHPRTTPLDGVGSGFLRDLEGRTTNETSTSDVELHTLRDYVPGDDRRYVHWRTSARSGKLMVRQFVDTRRSHVVLVHSCDPADYVSDDEFELSVSVLASIGVRALRDQQSVGVMSGLRPISTATARSLLDGTSGIDLADGRAALADAAVALLRRNGDATLAVLVTGSNTTTEKIRAAGSRFSPEVKVVAVRADVGAASSVRQIGPTLVLTVGALEDLPRLVRAAAQP